MGAIPKGLLALERSWIEARAAKVGGVTAAFRHLVRLNIAFDAVMADIEAEDKLVKRLRRHGRRGAEVERRVDAWRDTRESWRRFLRFWNLISWQRPGTADGWGDAPHDDPAHPLPRAAVRRLIAQGRSEFKR